MHTAYIRSDFVHCKIWEKFSGCHYACNFTKNWSSFIKSRTHFLSKISLLPCVDYFTKRIQKFVPYNALFSYKSTLKIFRTLEKCEKNSTMTGASTLLYKHFSHVLKNLHMQTMHLGRFYSVNIRLLINSFLKLWHKRAW